MASLKCEKLGEEPIISVESSSCNLMATDHGAKSWSKSAIRRRKNGRYSARIRDLIRHKEVWLGTFDTVEEALEAYFFKMSEFDKLVKLNQGNGQTLIAASLGRNKTIKSQETTHYVGVSKTPSWRYRARIGNPFSKKEFHLGTFDTAEEASRAYQSKKLEFHKLVKAKKQRNRQTHSSAGEKKQGGKVELINVDRGHETTIPEGFQPESASGASSSEIEIPISNSFNGGTIKDGSKDCFSSKSEFEKLSKRNMENEPKNCDQIQPESPGGASSYVGNDQTLIAVSLGRSKTIKPHESIHYVGVSKKTSWRYRARIRNPFSKKEFHLGTFDTAEEASRAYQSKKLEFQKLVEAKQQRNRQTHSSVGKKKQGGRVELSNVNLEPETIILKGCQPELASGATSSEIEIPISNSFNGGTIKDSSKDCFSNKSAFEKLSKQNMEDKPKNCDQIQSESPCGASLSVGNDQTLIAASSGRNKTIKSHETTHYVGVSKTSSWRYRARIQNPFSKKEFHVGTFDTAQEASQAYQSKKVEFQKLVQAKQQCNRQTPSSAEEKKQGGGVEFVNVKQGHETVNLEHLQPESASEASSSEIEVPMSNSFNEGTDHRTDSDQMSHFKWVKKRETGKCNLLGALGTDEEAFRADQCKKFNFQRPKKVVFQSNLPTDSSAGESPEGQEDEDSCTGKWVELPGDKAVKFSLKLGLPIIDNYGSLLGEFSSLDDLSFC